MSSFIEVISEEIADLDILKSRARQALMNPAFHRAKLQNAIEGIIPQIREFEGDVEELQEEFESLLAQLPGYVESVWTIAINEMQEIDKKIANYQEMITLYTDWQEEQKSAEEVKAEAEALANKELEDKEKIKTGEIEQPSKMTAIRRKKGARPPITLRKYRNTKGVDDGGEDSEA